MVEEEFPGTESEMLETHGSYNDDFGDLYSSDAPQSAPDIECNLMAQMNRIS